MKPRAQTTVDIDTRLENEIDLETRIEEEIEQNESIDREDLYILCEVGEEDGSLLTMFDYDLLCKRQDVDRCSCNEEQLYTL